MGTEEKRSRDVQAGSQWSLLFIYLFIYCLVNTGTREIVKTIVKSKQETSE